MRSPLDRADRDDLRARASEAELSVESPTLDPLRVPCDDFRVRRESEANSTAARS